MAIIMQSLQHYLISEDFYVQVNGHIQKDASGSFALVSIDYDNFNYINDLFSYEVGNKVLHRLAGHFSEKLNDGEYFSNIHADHFAFWLREEPGQSLLERLQDIMDTRECLFGLLPSHYTLVCSGGVAAAADTADTMFTLLDKANFARKHAKGHHRNTFQYYDNKLDEELEWRKFVSFSMEPALASHEFEMYLQPKILLKTNRIVGAEALARWNSPIHGMIYPERFIPVLEQNGFISELDFYMLEQACLFQRRSMSIGISALPISVNFSKLHVHAADFVDRLFHTVHGLDVPTELIEVEFTETVFLDDFQNLIEVSNQLKQLGFRVSLDDFGSAYSSLNCLKNLPLDIVKIDKGFLSASPGSDNSQLVITKMLELVKALRLTSVVEGVETSEQADFLQKLSCDLGQGFFYAKPMPADEYMELIKSGILPEQQEIPPSAPASPEPPEELGIDDHEFHNLMQSVDIGLMKAYLDNELTIKYINDHALEYLGYTRDDFRENSQKGIAAFIHPDNVATLKANTLLLVRTGKPVEFQTKALHKDGSVVTLRGHSSCMIDEQGRYVGIYAFQDVSVELRHMECLERSLREKVLELEHLVAMERENREALRLSEEHYRLIVEQSDDVMFEWNFQTDTMNFSDKYDILFGRPANRDHFSNSVHVRARVHPHDLPSFESWVEETYNQPNSSEAEFRLQTADGRYLWMRARSTPICAGNGTPLKAVGVFSNITKQKSELDSLKRKSQLDPLTKLFNKEETRRRIEADLLADPQQSGAFFIIDIDNFKGVNDNLGHQLGDTVLVETAQKISRLFRDSDIVGRIGGDEMVVFARGFSEPETICLKAEQLNQAIRSTYFGATSQLSISCSVGIAVYPAHGRSFGELYRLADMALYDSKNNGKNRYTLYHSELADGFSNSRTPFERSERFLDGYFGNDFTYSVFEMLYETKDTASSIQKILELTGKRFGVDRVYVFENSEDNLFSRNTYEWCAPGIQPEKDTLQEISIEALQPYLSAYTSEGILCCTDLATMDAYTYENLSRQGIQSFLHCAIYDSGEITGFIGFDVCRQQREWHGEEIATLAYLSRILSVFLLKNQTLHDLLESNRSYMDMLDNLNGYVYVVDCETFDMLYVNNVTRKLGFSVGQKCYKAAFGRDIPCEACPMRELTEDTPYATAEIYSTQLGGWVSSAASRLHWAGRKESALICCTDISRYKK